MSIPKLEFPPFHLPAEAEALRGEVRAFLKETLPRHPDSEDRFASWNTPSPEFSRALGAKGWLGITWPKQYGGAERSFLDRYGRDRGAAGQQRAGRLALGRRPAVGSAAAEVRQRSSSGRRSCRASYARRVLLQHRHERAGLGLGSGLRADARRAGARRLPRQRHQGVDLGRASQPLLHHPGAHLRASTATATRG
jgi:hypothetical protein